MRSLRLLTQTNRIIRPVARSFSSISAYPETKLSTLANGMRVASEASTPHSDTATIAVFIDAGSRYETPSSNGVAHFLEHMLFKGTGKRTRVQLETEIESIGASLNAYTSREQTVYLCKVSKSKISQGMDILSDIVTNSQYSEVNIERERDVILREMQEVDSQMEEAIFDRLHETAYRGTMLGKTILGPAENVKSITRNQIVDYVSTFYVGPRMVIAGAGAIDHQQLVDLTGQYFGRVPATGIREIKLEPAAFTGSDLRDRMDDMTEAHIALAFPTAGWNDPDTFPLMVIQCMLGNWDAKLQGGQYNLSRMVSSIASESVAKSVQVFNTQYSDTGLFGVYAVAPPEGQNQLLFCITRALTNLCYNCDPIQLAAAKNNAKMLMLAPDGSGPVCEDIGRQVLLYGRRMHPTEVVARIDAVDEAAVKNAATRYFYDRDHALAAVGPIHELPDYDWIRRKSYWLRY
jgi:processing peptidase subunit beta